MPNTYTYGIHTDLSPVELFFLIAVDETMNELGVSDAVDRLQNGGGIQQAGEAGGSTVMNDAWLQLQQFIREIRAPGLLGIDEELTRDMDLYHDLDWEPPKIVNVMETWGAPFRVDLSEFDVAYYAPSANMRRREAVLAALKSPFSAKARDSLAGRSLTLGMLEEAMKRGRWERE